MIKAPVPSVRTALVVILALGGSPSMIDASPRTLSVSAPQEARGRPAAPRTAANTATGAPSEPPGTPAVASPAAESAPSASVQALRLTKTVEAYNNLRPGVQSVEVSGLTLSSGHAKLVLKSGRAVPVLAGDETVGLFFKGQGGLEYTSADPVEYPVMAFNLKKSTALRFEKTDRLTVKDDFDTLLYLIAGRAQPALGGSPAASLADEFAAHRERFQRLMRTPASHQYALQKIDAPRKLLVRAELSGGQEDLLYLNDAVQARSESLEAVVKTGSEDKELRRRLHARTISDQPLDRNRRDPLPPRFLLADVNYTLMAPGGNDVRLSVTETIVPVEDGMSVFRFDLLNTTYNVVGAGKLQPRTLTLKSVADGSGRPLAFDHREDELLIALPAPVPAKQPFKIQLEIEGDVLIRPGGDNYWILGLEPWFPQPDLGEQAYTVRSTVKVKKPFVPFAPGTTLSRKTEGDFNVVENQIDQPVQFAIVLAGRYEYAEETRAGVTVRVASYAGRNERAWKQLTNLAYGIIEYYQNFLGPFPFTELNILEINEYGYGVAPPATMFITKEAFQSQIGEENQFFSQGVNERFAHEIAHQYWGHVVKMASGEEQWLTESFAEYSAALFLKKYEGKSVYNALVSTWKGNAKDAHEVSPIPLANRIWIKDDPFKAFVLRTHLIYDKGAYLLARLHAGMDDKLFLTFLKSYQKNFRWKYGSTTHVAGLLQFLTRKDYGPFFEANYWGTGMPE